MTRQLLAVLREGFEGPNGKVTYFLDSDGGLTHTLAKLNAAEASQSWGGNSVAAHAHHLLFSLDAFGAFIAGDRSQRDWNESWRVNTVDDGEWARLQQELGDGYQKLRETIKTHAESGGGGGRLTGRGHAPRVSHRREPPESGGAAGGMRQRRS